MPRVRAGAVELHYVEAGTATPDGTPLVMLHGLGGSHEMWLPLLPVLARDRRVIAGDHRGHGSSDKPAGECSVALLAADWLAALDALALPRVDLLGLSLGGAVAMRIAADRPDRVRRLVLQDTWGHPHPDFTAMMRQRLALLERGDLRGYAEAAIPQVYSASFAARHPEVLDAYRARVAATRPLPLAAAVRATIAHDMKGDLRAIRAPTLVVVGVHDRLTPPSSAERLVAEIPGARLRIFPQSAHFPNVEEPDAFTEVIRAFLAEVP